MLINVVTLDLWNTLFVEKDYSGWRLEILGRSLAGMASTENLTRSRRHMSQPATTPGGSGS